MEGYTYRYPHPAVTVDAVIFGWDGKELSVLLVERGGAPYKGYAAFPGGFLNIDEDARTGARRELKEETGLDVRDLEQIHAFTSPARDSRERVISIAYSTLVRPSEVKGGDDAAAARWYPLSSLPPLAFDHSRMLRIARERLRETASLRPVGIDAMPVRFSAADLAAMYAAVEGRAMKPEDFRRRAEAMPWIKRTMAEEGRVLYSFSEAEYLRCLSEYYSNHDDLL